MSNAIENLFEANTSDGLRQRDEMELKIFEEPQESGTLFSIAAKSSFDAASAGMGAGHAKERYEAMVRKD